MRPIVPRRSIMSKIKILVGAAIFGFFILGAFWPKAAANQPTSDALLPKNPAGIATSTPSGHKDDKLEVYLSQLAWSYECVGACQRAERNNEPYKRLDSNNQYSYGCFQFQQATYLAMAKKYKVDAWQNGGIYNCDNQWLLARLMFEEDPIAAAPHWYTSIYTRGLGLPNI